MECLEFRFSCHIIIFFLAQVGSLSFGEIFEYDLNINMLLLYANSLWLELNECLNKLYKKE